MEEGRHTAQAGGEVGIALAEGLPRNQVVAEEEDIDHAEVHTVPEEGHTRTQVAESLSKWNC